uniref:Uncharacterized protein n=1 Tax=Octopus bimaculoides TaxID=37653 RepID=A0A0L8GIK3_OCTBM
MDLNTSGLLITHDILLESLKYILFKSVMEMCTRFIVRVLLLYISCLLFMKPCENVFLFIKTSEALVDT